MVDRSNQTPSDGAPRASEAHRRALLPPPPPPSGDGELEAVPTSLAAASRASLATARSITTRPGELETLTPTAPPPAPVTILSPPPAPGEFDETHDTAEFFEEEPPTDRFGQVR